MTQETKTREHLSVKEMVQLAQWLAQHATRLHTATAAARAEEASKALGRKISGTQLHRVEQELGYEFRPKRESSRRVAVNDRTQMLAVAVVQLYKDLGQEPPTFVRWIAQRRAGDELAHEFEAWRNQAH